MKNKYFVYLHSKKCWVVLTQLWVKFLHYIFNPTFRVCPYLTQNWVKTAQHFLECIFDPKLG